MKIKSKKKLKIVLIIILVFFVALFVVFKIDSKKRTEKKINDNFTTFLEVLSQQNYEKLQNYLADSDGNELSHEQIKNYIINSGIYRKYLTDIREIPTSVDVGYLNTNKGTVRFSFIALDGEKITNTLEYVHKGADEYFAVPDKYIKSVDKEYKKIPLTLEGADFGEMKLDFSENNEDKEDTEIEIYNVKNDSDGKPYLYFYKESEKDLRKYFENHLEKEKKKYDESNSSKFTIDYNENFTQLDLYWKDKDNMNINFFTLSGLIFDMKYEIYIQLIDGNDDWHLTYNIYNADNKELIGRKKIR